MTDINGGGDPVCPMRGASGHDGSVCGYCEAMRMARDDERKRIDFLHAAAVSRAMYGVVKIHTTCGQVINHATAHVCPVPMTSTGE